MYFNGLAIFEVIKINPGVAQNDPHMTQG